MSVRTYALVGAGGALGAVARHLAATLTGGGPATTIVVNVVGCVAIGVLAARAADRSPWRLFLGSGVLGGFTTFSGYAIDVVGLADAGRWPLAALCLGGTVVAALAGTALGTALGTRAGGRA